ncbi:hypothetical protein ACPPVU_11435 [Mucilaginibacter sp. McL0603]|uniref:hypothetical protein n=1 Tax=Mucilaginibacter sp. McL0603 TaxID=3415670 RepID=UPI003CF6E0BE
MDLIINYRGFDNDIRNSFKDLIVEFHLELMELSEGSYLLKGESCNLRFTYDRGDIACDLKQPFDIEDSPGYNIWQVYRFLYPDKSKLEHKERLYDKKLQLLEHAEIIQENLKDVLSGNFSWLNKFMEDKKKEDKIFSIAFDLDYEHPIKIKLRQGDLTWRDDIEKYLIANNIVL